MYIIFICIILFFVLLPNIIVYMDLKIAKFKNDENLIREWQRKRSVFTISTILDVISFIIILPLLLLFHKYLVASIGEFNTLLISMIIGSTLGLLNYKIAKFIYPKLENR